MLLSIRNAFLSLTVDTLGAQMMSLRSGGTEYLWQGGREYWADRAPTLFPFIGRLTENRCMFHGKSYSMGIHGFAAQSEFLPLEQSPESLVLCLTASAATRAQYPFDFSLKISYCLKENVLEITYSVYNASDCVMPFAIGGHPGFRVPFSDSDCFEDYVLDFSQECRPDRVGFTPAVYLSGRDEPFPLEGGRRLHLRHDLFDDDAIIHGSQSDASFGTGEPFPDRLLPPDALSRHLARTGNRRPLCMHRALVLPALAAGHRGRAFLQKRPDPSSAPSNLRKQMDDYHRQQGGFT